MLIRKKGRSTRQGVLVWTLIFGLSSAQAGFAQVQEVLSSKKIEVGLGRYTGAPIDPILPPILNAPLSNTGGSFNVSWNAVSRAAIYQVQVSKNRDFLQVIIERFPGGTNEDLSVFDSGTYFVRVRAYDALPENGGRPSDWSNITATAVTITLPAPQLSAPASASSSPFTVTWTAVPNAILYQVQSSPDAGFASNINEGFPSGTSEPISVGQSGTYFVRVRAYTVLPQDGGVPSDWSNVTSTIVKLPIPAPQLSAPASASSSPFTVTWTAVPNAILYQVQSSPDAGFASNINEGFPSGTSEPISVGQSGTYFVRVKAHLAVPEVRDESSDWSNVTSTVVTLS